MSRGNVSVPAEFSGSVSSAEGCSPADYSEADREHIVGRLRDLVNEARGISRRAELTVTKAHEALDAARSAEKRARAQLVRWTNSC